VTKGNILISSAGRRVGLIECFRDTITSRRADMSIFTIDSGSSAPASFASDGASQVPHCTDPCFVDAVLQYCSNKDIGLLIPTIDTELPIYASAFQRFAEIGVVVCISAPSTVRICRDKSATHNWLVTNGFPSIRQTDIRTAILDPAAWPLPLIAKPFNGSASIGVRRVETRLELQAMGQATDGYIVQEICSGREYTINLYVNREGECICTIPHWRIEVRAGEVSKGITVKDHRLMGLGRDVAKALPGAYGPLNIQCFMDEAGTIRIIEINARFGGGYPLAHRAGGRFTDWLLDEIEGKRLSYFEDWTDDLAMLRYDEAIFVPGSRIRG